MEFFNIKVVIYLKKVNGCNIYHKTVNCKNITIKCSYKAGGHCDNEKPKDSCHHGSKYPDLQNKLCDIISVIHNNNLISFITKTFLS